MQLSEAQFERQSCYEAALASGINLHKDGSLSVEELAAFKSYLIERYKPIIRH